MLRQPCVPLQGLLPLYIHPQTGDATTQMVSLGAMGDSYYEYLLKVWIYKGRRSEDDMYRGMWERSMDEMLETLLFKNEESGYTYVAEFARSGPLRTACYPEAAATVMGSVACSMSQSMGDEMGESAAALWHAAHDWRLRPRACTSCFSDF